MASVPRDEAIWAAAYPVASARKLQCQSCLRFQKGAAGLSRTSRKSPSPTETKTELTSTREAREKCVTILSNNSSKTRSLNSVWYSRIQREHMTQACKCEVSWWSSRPYWPNLATNVLDKTNNYHLEKQCHHKLALAASSSALVQASGWNSESLVFPPIVTTCVMVSAGIRNLACHLQSLAPKCSTW